MVFIYILLLEQQKYYVGKTNNPIFRLKDHFHEGSKNGAAWTRKYQPLEVEKIIPNCDNFDEDKINKMYMKQHGIDNVRGGSYVKISLDEMQTLLLEKEIFTAENSCFHCGQKGHFIATCPNLKQTEVWHKQQQSTVAAVEERNGAPIIVFCESWCFCRK